MGLLYYISYVAVLAAFAFVTLSLASGLLYFSELIEEHSRPAKVIGQRSIYAIIILHVLLYFFDALPLLQITFSITCHIVYLQNFSSSWPLISLTSLSFLSSCVFVIADHLIWFFYFSRMTQEARHHRSWNGPPPNVPGFIEVASFFGLCVWLAPLFLFLSLSANDNALPVSAAEPGSPSTMQSAQTRVSLFRSIFPFDGIPRLRSPLSRRDTSEGLIAPRSPLSPPSPTLTSPRYNTLSPSRSPHIAAQEPSGHLSPTTAAFKLGAQSRRPPQPLRRQTGEPAGLGLRRTASSRMANENNVFQEGH